MSSKNWKRVGAKKDRNASLGKGWVASAVVITLDGKEIQRERYPDIRAGVPLQPDLYDTAYRKPKWISGR